MILLLIISLMLIISFAVMIILFWEDWVQRKSRGPIGWLNRFWVVSERRRSIRFKARVKVRYSSRDVRRITQEATSRDISKEGIGLVLYEKLNIGTHIRLEIEIPSQAKPVVAVGELVWIREVPKKRLEEPKRIFYAGVKFLYISVDNEEKLNYYIRRISAGAEPVYV